ncbi:hypothetical protein QOT17_022658 [Balamuthia mandrillaris]
MVDNPIIYSFSPSKGYFVQDRSYQKWYQKLPTDSTQQGLSFEPWRAWSKPTRSPTTTPHSLTTILDLAAVLGGAGEHPAGAQTQLPSRTPFRLYSQTHLLWKYVFIVASLHPEQIHGRIFELN